MVEAEKWAYARPRMSLSCPYGEQHLGIGQFLREIMVDVGTLGRVHITAQDRGGLAFFISEPFRAHQHLGLRPAPNGRKPEVGIYYLYAVPFKVNLDPERAPARFLPSGRQTACFYRPNGIPAQYCVPITSILDAQARMKLKVHAEFTGNEFCLVDASRPRQTNIEFLQRHYIGTHSRNYFRYPHRQVLSVIPDAAMNIVRHD